MACRFGYRRGNLREFLVGALPSRRIASELQEASGDEVQKVLGLQVRWDIQVQLLVVLC